MTPMTTRQGALSRLHGAGRAPVGDHERALHWGAAIGAVLLAAGEVTDTVLGATAAGAQVSQVHVRLAAGAGLMVGCGLALAGVCVHLDTVSPRRLSWVAVVVAVLGWVSVLPLCWMLVTGRDQLPAPVLIAPALGLWLPLVGVAALVERTWHRWLGALTVGVAGLLWAGLWLALMAGVRLGPVLVVVTPMWAAVFAVAQVSGPHPVGASGRRGRTNPFGVETHSNGRSGAAVRPGEGPGTSRGG